MSSLIFEFIYFILVRSIFVQSILALMISKEDANSVCVCVCVLVCARTRAYTVKINGAVSLISLLLQ